MAEDLQLYVAGEWTPGTGATVHRLESPATGEHVTTTIDEFTDLQPVVLHLANVR